MLENSNNHICNGAIVLEGMVYPLYTDATTGEVLYEDETFPIINNIWVKSPIEILDLQAAVDAYVKGDDIGFILEQGVIYILHSDETYTKYDIGRTTVLETGEYDTLESRELEDLEID